MKDKIDATYLERGAAVYLRQSTLKQLHENRESTARQYDLQQRALKLGWIPERIKVIDEDLGQSGTSTAGRDGFQRMAEDVAQGRIGAIFALEASRLSRSSADWHRLLDLCGLADVLLVDEQAVYTPRDYNDRLLLGLKGTMSEAEQYWMRLRLQGGSLSKARRGELFFLPASGYVWDKALSRFRLDPDENVQKAIRLVFERFRVEKSAHAVARYFISNGLKLPVRSLAQREVRWVPVRATLIGSILHNPIYAGAYVYGRHESRVGLVDGQVRRVGRTVTQDAWKVCLRDQHPGYISWDEFMANQRKLHDNRTTLKTAEGRGAAREGGALLQGIVLCGRCGRRMHTQYCGPRRRAVYDCVPSGGCGSCWSVPARTIDEVVEKLFLQVVTPPEIELGLAVLRETERQASQVEGQWKLRIERARYEAQLAERRYKVIDPDNRVVARTLEREWNDKLVELEQLEREREEVRRREKVQLDDADRTRILALSKNLSSVWHADTTTHADRKNMLRMLMSEVTLHPVDVPERSTRVCVLWQTGAVSEFTVARRDKYTVNATSTEALELIRRWVDKQDKVIAAELNRRDMRTATDQPWTISTVRRARYDYGFYRATPKARRAPERGPEGLCSLHGVAAALGVKPAVVRAWVHKGIIEPVRRGGPGHPSWYQLDKATLDRLQAVKSEMDARRATHR